MRRLNSGLVMGTAALVVALGGTATAATTMITGADVRDASLTGRDIRNGSVGPSDLSRTLRDALGRVAPAATSGNDGRDGAPGAPGVPGLRGATGASGTQGPQGVQGVEGSRGPVGIQGPPGAFDATLVRQIQGPVATATAGGEAVSTAGCPAATVVLGGGVTTVDADLESFRVVSSSPLSSDSWIVRGYNGSGASKAATFRAVAICAIR